MLRSAGAGAGALGIGAFLAACGVKGASTVSSGSSPAGGVGTAAWWAKQKLHHTVNFANWPYYIDVLNGKHLSLVHGRLAGNGRLGGLLVHVRGAERDVGVDGHGDGYGRPDGHRDVYGDTSGDRGEPGSGSDRCDGDSVGERLLGVEHGRAEL